LDQGTWFGNDWITLMVAVPRLIATRWAAQVGFERRQPHALLTI